VAFVNLSLLAHNTVKFQEEFLYGNLNFGYEKLVSYEIDYVYFIILFPPLRTHLGEFHPANKAIQSKVNNISEFLEDQVVQLLYNSKNTCSQANGRHLIHPMT
jgi:hypothetical protein